MIQDDSISSKVGGGGGRKWMNRGNIFPNIGFTEECIKQHQFCHKPPQKASYNDKTAESILLSKITSAFFPSFFLCEFVQPNLQAKRVGSLISKAKARFLAGTGGFLGTGVVADTLACDPGEGSIQPLLPHAAFGWRRG